MSQQSKTTLQSAINIQIADNTSGDISAADIRNNLINITDSLVFNTGSQSITGSLTVNGGITGSLQGTATTASYVPGTIVKTYGGFPMGSAAFNFQTTASYVGYVVPIPQIQPYYSIDLTLATWAGAGPFPVVIKLYAATSSIFTTNTGSDILIGTYSASIGNSSSIQQIYRLKRSFYQQSVGSTDPDQTEYYLMGANPTASILSDDLINDIYTINLGTYYDGGPAYVGYPFLKIIGQTNAGAFYSYTYGFGPLRVTYNNNASL
jgi:hypothetical protein